MSATVQKILQACLLSGVALALVACASVNHDAPPAPYFGEEAHAFLTLPVTVEIVPCLGRTPAPAAVSFLRQRISENVRGPVSVVIEPQAPYLLSSWDERSASVSGHYGANLNVIAETYGPHSICVFPDVVNGDERVGPAVVHEFGHVLGLVRNPSHQDPSHRLHCEDSSCVMFWTPSGGDDFCRKCKADLSETAKSP